MNDAANSVRDVVVIGAGISGLVAAWQLRRKNCDVTVFEAADRAGGCVRTERINDFLVDYGPNSGLNTRPCIQEMVTQLGLDDEFILASSAAQNRYIFKSGSLNALPTSLGKFLRSKHFSCLGKARIAFEPFVSKSSSESDVSLADFVRRRLGEEFLNYAIDPFVAGVFAGNPAELSVRAAFPALWNLEQEYGSLMAGAILGRKKRQKRATVSKASARMFSFRGGMQTLTNSLAAALGERVCLRHSVRKLEQGDLGFRIAGVNDRGEEFVVWARNVVLAVPAYVAASIVAGLDASAASALEKIYYPPVTVVFHGIEDEKIVGTPLNGFGYLIPRVEQMSTLGTLWNSSIFEGRCARGAAAFTTFVGGSRQPAACQRAPEEVRAAAWSETARIMKIEAQPSAAGICHWERAIPQYRVGHLALMRELERSEQSHSGLYYLANYRGGISMSDCIGNATEFANRLVGSSKEKIMEAQ